MSCSSDCREAQKEKELLDKKVARLEAARSTDVSALQTELEASKTSAREQLKERDAKVNELIEELGNTQALLSDKTEELAQVTLVRTFRKIQADECFGTFREFEFLKAGDLCKSSAPTYSFFFQSNAN